MQNYGKESESLQNILLILQDIEKWIGNDMTIIADSGATKTDWVVVGKNKEPYYFHTEGINPFHQGEEDIRKVLQRFVEEMGVAKDTHGAESVQVYFYGAGCAGDMVAYMQRLLHEELSKPTKALLQV